MSKIDVNEINARVTKAQQDADNKAILHKHLDEWLGNWTLRVGCILVLIFQPYIFAIGLTIWLMLRYKWFCRAVISMLVVSIIAVTLLKTNVINLDTRKQFNPAEYGAIEVLPEPKWDPSKDGFKEVK